MGCRSTLCAGELYRGEMKDTRARGIKTKTPAGGMLVSSDSLKMASDSLYTTFYVNVPTTADFKLWRDITGHGVTDACHPAISTR